MDGAKTVSVCADPSADRSQGMEPNREELQTRGASCIPILRPRTRATGAGSQPLGADPADSIGVPTVYQESSALKIGMDQPGR
jgi:hypothetical protein